MNKILLDASALLAVLNLEPGTDRLTPELLSTADKSWKKLKLGVPIHVIR